MLGSTTLIVQPHRAALTKEEKVTREKSLKQIWRFHVNDEINVTTLIQTRAAFSVMGKIGGWHVEGRVEGDERYDGSQFGGRLAAGVWIFPKTAISNGQRYIEAFPDQK